MGNKERRRYRPVLNTGKSPMYRKTAGMTFHPKGKFVLASDCDVYIAELEQDIARLEAVFDLRRAADQRATTQWQEATGRDSVWPDHADMVVWLLERMGELEVDLINWKHWKGLASKAAERLERERDEARKSVGFFASVARGGEKWTPHCDVMMDRGMGRTPPQEAPHG